MTKPVSSAGSTRPKPSIVWFRQDLRIADNPALARAAKSGPVLPVYILDTATAEWQPGAASRWWLHHSIVALKNELHRRYGASLLLLRGDPAELLPALAQQTDAAAILWNRVYEPAAIRRDTAIKARLREDGRIVETFNSALLFEPWTIQTRTKGWYKVFTPFWRACRAAEPPPLPLPAPDTLIPCDPGIAGENPGLWSLLPRKPDWSAGLRETWTPGEIGAEARLAYFLDTALPGYAGGRDRPDKPATSGLSPHLHFGEIGPRQIWHALRMRAEGDRSSPPGTERSTEKFLSELGWREFSHHLLYHMPHLPERNFREDFDSFPWTDNPAARRQWQRGETGYPIIDAGMRELWRTGWMHNRVRMIVASFLVKHLGQHWRHGADWFWDTLVDADLANNTAGWQWVAGCGADAAPYFRIFNPVLQGEKFDPAGDYVRKWVPELARLADRYLHKPWMASSTVLAQAGVVLGQTYPAPMVNHDNARRIALAAFASLRHDGEVTVGRHGQDR